LSSQNVSTVELWLEIQEKSSHHVFWLDVVLNFKPWLDIGLKFKTTMAHE